MTPRQFREHVRQFRDDSCEQLAALDDKSSPRAIELQSRIDEMDEMLIATDRPEYDPALDLDVRTPLSLPDEINQNRKRY